MQTRTLGLILLAWIPLGLAIISMRHYRFSYRPISVNNTISTITGNAPKNRTAHPPLTKTTTTKLKTTNWTSIDDVTRLMGGLRPRDFYDMNVNVTAPHPYNKSLLNGCSLNERIRKANFFLLKWLLGFTAELDIVWFLADGNAIGVERHNDFVPYDLDIDVIIIDTDEQKVRVNSAPRTQKLAHNSIITRPGNFCLGGGKLKQRQTCNGTMTNRFSDACAFCGPFARYYAFGSDMDLWRMTRKDNKNGEQLITTYPSPSATPVLLHEYKFKMCIMKYDVIFPLKPCKYIGLTLPCVNKPDEYLSNIYRDWRKPAKVCRQGRWVTQAAAAKMLLQKPKQTPKPKPKTTPKQKPKT